MGKRIGLFLLTNIAIIAVVSVILKIFNVEPYLSAQGINYQALLIFAALFGFAGSFISLALSKFMAKQGFGVKIIDSKTTNSQEAWLVSTIQRLANQAGIGMPEVGIYDSPEPNAFATGARRDNALVAVSTGLLQAMDQDEVEGVLGHEISHVANGDMITLALIQGIVNTFVIFFARIVAYLVMTFFSRDDGEAIGGLAYYGVAILFQIIFGILASMVVMWFSRRREFSADAGSASLLGRDKMIKALQRLQVMTTEHAAEDKRVPSMNAMKISSHDGVTRLFSSHPPLAERIKALQKSSIS